MNMDEHFKALDDRLQYLYDLIAQGKPLPKGPPEYEEKLKRAVASQQALQARLNSKEPGVREAALDQIARAGVRFIMTDPEGDEYRTRACT